MPVSSVRTVRSVRSRRVATVAAALTGSLAALAPALPARAAAESCSASYQVLQVQPASGSQPARFTGEFRVTNTGTVTLNGMWWVPASWPSGSVVDQAVNAHITPNSAYAFTPATSIAVINPGQSVTFQVIGRPANPAGVTTATPNAYSCQLV
ncbi:cellulose binding domain-containing protein [Plantactinospora sonchi]|uniref:Cellulose binding domain-containing protein n=1 Tax=Plantactinospora sonchi TaxID=1544735 RepID=A0ABU7RNM8_9ACTN